MTQHAVYDARYKALLDAIRMKCSQSRWFGGSLDDPKQLGNEGDPRRMGFVFPPATEVQLHATETALGVALPPLVRMLLQQLANGGFGPGGGLRGAIGGYGTPSDPGDPTDLDETLVGPYLFKRHTTQFVEHIEDLGVWEEKVWKPGRDQTQVLLFSDAFWPMHVLPIGDMGCLQEACLDVQTGEIVLVVRAPEEHLALTREASSLEDWLVGWVHGVWT